MAGVIEARERRSLSAADLREDQVRSALFSLVARSPGRAAHSIMENDILSLSVINAAVGRRAVRFLRRSTLNSR